MVTQAVSEKAEMVANLICEGPVYIQVIGAGTLRVGDDPQILQQNPNDGIPFAVANNPLPQCMFWWVGPLYVIGNISMQAGGVPFSIQTPSISKKSKIG
jgi:hypothetical protein